MVVNSAKLIILQNLDADKLLDQFGKYGRYQIFVYAMASINFYLVSYLTTIISLIGEFPIDKCSSNNLNVSSLITNKTTNNNDYISLADEFGITCETSDSLDHANGVFMLGNFMAAPVSTYLADRYGRRMTFLIPLWLLILLTFACAFSPTFICFLIFRFLSGACGAAVLIVGFVLTVESVSGSFRSIQALLNALIWVFGIFSVGILHLFIKNWRYLYLCISFPLLISIFYYKAFPESLHWLIANKKTKEIQKYIIKSCKINKININLNISKFYFSFIIKFIILNFVYWALTLYSVNLHQNKMVGFFLSAIVEIPAGLISMFLLMFFGRRTVTIISLTGQAISLGLTIFTPIGSTTNLFLSLFAKTMNIVAWASAPLLLSEMSPTTIRNMSYGFVSTIGELGSVLAPYMKRIDDENKQKGIIALMSILAVIFSMMAPETNGKSLPQDLNDFDSGPFIYFIKKYFSTFWPFNKKDKKINKNNILLEERIIENDEKINENIEN
ncbi:Transporter, major facilitator family protein [Meloidogyne graminicola]|uniref:Transporter, major facilitator family protein n=1 Tax=Meloidogyne graminicola TaxID=189291 RepID=A0A8S9ZSC3_9BILA|nr:Transporter, major facilitator family protein [Meloidogyne graminicola]